MLAKVLAEEAEALFGDVGHLPLDLAKKHVSKNYGQQDYEECI